MKYVYRCKGCNHRQPSNDDMSIEHVCDKCGSTDLKLEEVNLNELSHSSAFHVVIDEKKRRADGNPVSTTYMWKDNKGSLIAIHMLSDEQLELLTNFLCEKKESSKNIMPFGKYKGQQLADVPDSYMAWLLKQGTLKDPLKSKIEDLIWNRIKKNCLNDWVERNLSKSK